MNRRKYQSNHSEVDDGKAAYNTNANPKKVTDQNVYNDNLLKIQITGANFIMNPSQIDSLYETIN